MNTLITQARTAADEVQAVTTIVAAFADDPAVRWMYPEPGQYQDFFPDFVRAFAGASFACGSAEGLEGWAATALWIPPGIQPDEQSIASVIQRSLAENRQTEMFRFMERMGQFHPTEPHWYLPLIGTVPGRQNRGYGSVLLRHALARCDEAGLPAYLESTNPRNQPLYEKFGFRAVGRIQSETSPPVIPMLRPPRQQQFNQELEATDSSRQMAP